MGRLLVFSVVMLWGTAVAAISSLFTGESAKFFVAYMGGGVAVGIYLIYDKIKEGWRK